MLINQPPPFPFFSLSFIFLPLKGKNKQQQNCVNRCLQSYWMFSEVQVKPIRESWPHKFCEPPKLIQREVNGFWPNQFFQGPLWLFWNGISGSQVLDIKLKPFSVPKEKILQALGELLNCLGCSKEEWEKISIPEIFWELLTTIEEFG